MVSGKWRVPTLFLFKQVVFHGPCVRFGGLTGCLLPGDLLLSNSEPVPAHRALRAFVPWFDPRLTLPKRTPRRPAVRIPDRRCSEFPAQAQ